MHHAHFETIDSTQLYLKNNYSDLAKKNREKNILISSSQQSKGIGRHGNSWDHYKNSLAFSFSLEITQNKNNEVNFILNISEDGWFGGTIGPYQHFTKAIFRAIESNTYLLRSANKGISAFINNKGISIKRLEPYESGNIELKVPLIQNNYKNKNDLIFFLLLFTYTVIFLTLKNRFK